MSVPRRAWVASPGGRVSGDARLPGDKSISHRAILLSAIAEGNSEIDGLLDSDDCAATLTAVAAMGVRYETAARGHLVVYGAGLHGLRDPAAPLDLGNSGTSMRLLSGILAGQSFDTTLVGDQSLMQRPMERVAAPLRRMGAEVRTRNGRAPIAIGGNRPLHGCHHVLDAPSAQVKSALLLAGLQARGRTSVLEPGVSRDHTERMLGRFGVQTIRDEHGVSIEGPATLHGTAIRVPGDFSSAAFFIAAGLVAGSGSLILRDVGINPTRTALLEILGSMGAQIRLRNAEHVDGEPRADIEVSPSKLTGIEVPASLVPVAMDEMPVLFALAALARGETVVTGASELRVKESDRIAAMAGGLAALGIDVEERPDGLRIRGGAVQGGTVESRHDHRVAMAFAVLAACAAAPVIILDVQNVSTSFPGFAETARALGLRIAEER